MFLNLISKNLIGDLTLCFVVFSFVVGVLFGIVQLNGIDNSNVFQKPDYNEYWIQQILAPIANVCCLHRGFR